MSLFDLTGRVAIVTGGNGGIGLGMARGLAQAGAAIAIVGRNQAKSEAAAAEIAKLGAKTAVLTVDVTDEGQCRRMVDDTVTRLGRLDILVNNAGINIRKAPQEYTAAEWKQVIDTNLTSAFTCSQAAYATMKGAGGGKIINIGSMMSIFGASFTTPYAASKGGIVQMTKAMATGRGLGQGQHPGQRCAAGLDRHRPHPRRPRADQGSQHHGADANPGGALGCAERSLWRRRVPRQPRFRFHHRRGHSGGWGVLGPDLGAGLREYRCRSAPPLAPRG